jgi:translation initiation factor 2 subunit 2
MNYRELLDRARSQLPSDIHEHKRFEVPTPRSHVVGMRTILSNFKEICEALNRDPRHVLKFFSGEMATAATMQRNRAIFQGKFGYDTFERLIQRYVKEFVVCPVCTRPDTKIVKDKRFLFLVCEACGARSSISNL